MPIYTLTLQSERGNNTTEMALGDTFIVIIKGCLFDNLQCNRWQIPSNPGITVQPAFPACPSVGPQNNVMTQRLAPTATTAIYNLH